MNIIVDSVMKVRRITRHISGTKISSRFIGNRMTIADDDDEATNSIQKGNATTIPLGMAFFLFSFSCLFRMWYA